MTVIPIEDVITALEGPYNGKRISYELFNDDPGDGYCCLGVMAKLAGVDPENMRGQSLPNGLLSADWDMFRAAFPWAVVNEPLVAPHPYRVLSTANDRMDPNDRSYSAPIEVLRKWADEGVSGE